MQHLLGRIERQYILDTLSVSLTSFSISYGNELFSVPQSSYSVLDSLIVLQNSFPENLLNKTCTIRFHHKDRLLSFLSKPNLYNENSVSFQIPLHITKEEQGYSISDVYVDFNLNDTVLRFFHVKNLPLYNIVQNPLVLAEKRFSIEKLALKVGLSSFSTPIAYRLYESIEWFSHNQTEMREIIGGGLLFIDHEAILLLTTEDQLNDQNSKCNHFVTIKYDKRIIKGEGIFKGELKLNRHYCIRYFVFIDIQEEDRRFLFESCYDFRYT